MPVQRETASAPAWAHLPALDGLRAVAVVAVVLFHYWEAQFPGGFVGVDLFFVLSGYLITGILVTERRRHGRIDLRAFWGRRVRRLVPAVVALVVATSVAAALVGEGSTRQVAHSLGALTWTTNLVEVAFGQSRIWQLHRYTVLDHLWSLAIEEQFYLVWPLVLLGVLRLRSRGARLAAVGALIVASATAMGVVGGLHAYLRTDTRAFELMAGAALALAVGGGRPKLGAVASSALALVGLGTVVGFVAFARPGDAWMYPWGFAVIAAAGVALVAAAASPPVWLAVAFGARPVRHLGRLSYGVYLWHIPVLRLVTAERLGVDGVGLRAAQLAVLAAVVELSYRFVEQPFRERRVPLGARHVAVGYAVALVALVPMVGVVRDDVANRWNTLQPMPTATAGQRRVMVVGDLVGATIGRGLSDRDVAGDAADVVWPIADAGCPTADHPAGDPAGRIRPFDERGQPLSPDESCRHWRARWRDAVDRFDPDVVVVAAGFWDTFELRRGDRTIDGDALEQRYRAVVDEQVRIAAAGDPRRRVLVARIDDWSALLEPGQDTRARRAAIDAYNRAIDAAVAERGGEVWAVGGTPDWDALADLGGSGLP